MNDFYPDRFELAEQHQNLHGRTGDRTMNDRCPYCCAARGAMEATPERRAMLAGPEALEILQEMVRSKDAGDFGADGAQGFFAAREFLARLEGDK